jgi:hypothetical protein
MSFIIYADPFNAQDSYECPDSNPELHERCKLDVLYAKQHVFFLSE